MLSWFLKQDVQWTDGDYMDGELDWTYDHKAYNGLPDLVDELHNTGMHYILILV